jgi:hypothetical protein
LGAGARHGRAWTGHLRRATTGFDAKVDLRFLFSRQLSLLSSFMGTMGTAPGVAVRLSRAVEARDRRGSPEWRRLGRRMSAWRRRSSLGRRWQCRRRHPAYYELKHLPAAADV